MLTMQIFESEYMCCGSHTVLHLCSGYFSDVLVLSNMPACSESSESHATIQAPESAIITVSWFLC